MSPTLNLNLDGHMFKIYMLDTGLLITASFASKVGNPNDILERFMDKYSRHAEIGYVIHTKDLKVEGKFIYIPIYMAMFL